MPSPSWIVREFPESYHLILTASGTSYESCVSSVPRKRESIKTSLREHGDTSQMVSPCSWIVFLVQFGMLSDTERCPDHSVHRTVIAG